MSKTLPRSASQGAIRFLARYVRRRVFSHVIVLAAVLAAVVCAVGSQYAVKNLVDVLGTQHPATYTLWSAVALLLALVAGDNLLWRLAGWVSTHAFVAVGGDIRLDLFDHLSGQGTRYFVERLPGALAGRITAAANAAWTIEKSLTWTIIPPGTAVIGSILMLGTINWHLTVVLLVVVGALGVTIGRLAAQGRHLHQSFAGHAAHVSGDLADIVSNIGLVRAFGAARRERDRLSSKIQVEMQAQRASLRSLEILRLWHAVTVFTVTAGVLVWSVELWRRGKISTGDVVLTTTLGFTVLHASRDFAMALVDMVQQDISLFHRSLLENLRYGRPEATDEQVFRAVEAARCTEFINGLPQGFDTVVGDRGMKLSGGQRQRLAIARAFLMDAPIVVLDEATSSLDTESEQSIQEALSRLFKGRTVIAIAHRLSTLDAFDRIVVLDRGRIA